MRNAYFSFFRLLVILLVAVLGLACSLPFLGTGSSETATLPPTLTLQPTDPPAPSSTPPPSPTAPPPTSAPTNLPRPTDLPKASPTPEARDFFVEEFDRSLDEWDLFFMHGEERDAQVFTEDDRLTFYLDGEEIYAYLVYLPYMYSDVLLKAVVENRGYNNNNVSLLCRYDPNEGWYEFNIANNGLYWILFFDINSGRYEYLSDGGSTAINMGKAVNEYVISCEGNNLTLYINGKEIKRFVERKYVLKEGMVGVSVSSFNVYPIEVDFLSLEISPP